MLARDVAYDLIPFAQRRGLHARLAEALETTLPRASATTIAFHYSKSCHAVEGAEWKRAVKAIQYWEMAGEEAMEGIDHHQVGQSSFESSEIKVSTSHSTDPTASHEGKQIHTDSVCIHDMRSMLGCELLQQMATL